MLDKQRRWIRRHRWGFLAAYISIAGFCYLGIWAYLEPMNPPEKLEIRWSGGSFSTPRLAAHVAASLTLAAHLTLLLLLPPRRKQSVVISETKREALSKLLEAAARMVAYPREPAEVGLRAFCHRADPTTHTLQPLCYWSAHHVDEYAAPIPYSGRWRNTFVISTAFNERNVIARQLDDDTRKQYPRELRDKIRADLKCVLAAPLCAFEPDGNAPIGTLAFDSDQCTLEEIGFNSDAAKHISQVFAEAVYGLLMMDSEEGAKE